jgi:hypothetical protein
VRYNTENRKFDVIVTKLLVQGIEVVETDKLLKEIKVTNHGVVTKESLLKALSLMMIKSPKVSEKAKSLNVPLKPEFLNSQLPIS